MVWAWAEAYFVCATRIRLVQVGAIVEVRESVVAAFEECVELGAHYGRTFHRENVEMRERQ